MRIFSQLFLVTMLMLLSSSCEQKPNNPVSQYGDTVVDAYKNTGNKVSETMNLDVLRTAVQTYHASHGAYPRSLDDIKDSVALTVDLSRYNYNPDNGVVSLKK